MPLPQGYTLDTSAATDGAAPSQSASSPAPSGPNLPKGYTLDSTPAPQQPGPDLYQKAVNYRTGNDYIDAPLGVVQGAAKGVANLGEDIGSAARWAMGKPQASQAEVDADTKPNGIGQGTGKFLEQAAEFALPAGEVGKAMKGAGTLAKAGAQAVTGGAVGALQSHGDLGETATDAALGGAGELAGAAIKGAAKLVSKRAPTIANFSKSFGGATPTQTARLTKHLDILKADGVEPHKDVFAMQEALGGKLQDLGKQYDALPANISQRAMDPSPLIADLKNQQAKYAVVNPTTGEMHVANAHRPYFDKIQSEIRDVKKLADMNGGKISVSNLKYLRDGANGQTPFTAPDADKNLYRGIGNAYRGALDSIAPETTPLNKRYAVYTELKDMLDQNIDRGKGVKPSGMDILLQRANAHRVGSMVGAGVGGAVGGLPGAAVGSAVGDAIGSKLSEVTRQGLQNAIDSGKFAALPKARQQMLMQAAKIGDQAGILKILGMSGTQAAATDRK